MRHAAPIWLALFFIGLCTSPAQAEVINARADQYHLQHKAHSKLPPAELWQRLIKPASWWLADHSYSGDSANLSLDPQAGGLWREDWTTEAGNNSVAHGRVLAATPHKLLRLDAPFGPLQGLAVQVVWTISLAPSADGGTEITFDERATGTADSGLDKLAPAVDFVKTQAIQSLAEKSKTP